MTSVQYCTCHYRSVQYSTVQYTTCQYSTISNMVTFLDTALYWVRQIYRTRPSNKAFNSASNHPIRAQKINQVCDNSQYSTVHVNTVQYTSVQYITVHVTTAQYTSVQYSSHQYSTVHISKVQCMSEQYTSVQFSYLIASYLLRLENGKIDRLRWDNW